MNGRWAQTYYDGLGRTVKVESGTGDLVKSIVKTEYGACACSPLGKVSRVSMPYAPGGTVYWTSYTYDELGRTVSVIQPNGTGTTTYGYWDNNVSVTDPAGKWKTMTVDGFGNLVTVGEPNPAGGAWTTSYAYNAFNQLTTVTMPRPTGTQTRTFVYDANGRLASVTQPETGTTAYTYNAAGLLATRRDAKQQLTEYSYDAYNRAVQILRYKRVSGADVLDPMQKTLYSFDSAVNGWGRLGSVSTYQNFADLNSDGSMPIVESFEYTPAGLVSKKTLNVTGVSAVSVNYEWDLEGRPVGQKFPDMATGNPSLDTGPRFTWGYDSMGRLSTMGQTEAWGGFASTLVSGVTYNAAGQMTQLVKPGGTEDRTYSELGQLTVQCGLGQCIQYIFSGTANDGRMTMRKDWVSGEEVSYLYDSLGRLTSAATTGTQWGLSFTYDGFGNKTQQTVTKGTGPSHSYSVDAATNRLGVGTFGYDANGNVISGLAGLAGTYTYDVENRMVDNGAEKYGYGVGNRRLWRSTTFASAEVYLYGLRGEVLEVFAGRIGSPLERYSWNPTQRAWFGGRLLEKKGTAMNADRLGSYEKTFPYGEAQGTATPPGEKFATYWRDGTGLDYAVNRYYSSQMGRFLSADPYQASGGLGDPGSWNRYAYVGGDPVNRADPTGFDDYWVSGGPFSGTLYGSTDGRSALGATGNGKGGLDIMMPDMPDNGEGGGSNDPPNKGGWWTDPKGVGNTGWQYLSSIWSDCLSAFKTGARFSATTFETLLKSQIRWLDARESNIADTTVDSYSHSGDMHKLGDYLSGSASAVALMGSSYVALGRMYFSNETQTQQIAGAIHEALHLHLGMDDGQLAGWLSKFGFRPSDTFTSGEISDWIVGTKDQMSTVGGGCKHY